MRWFVNRDRRRSVERRSRVEVFIKLLLKLFGCLEAEDVVLGVMIIRMFWVYKQ